MTPLLFTLILFAIATTAGVLGSLVGVGGGIIVVPALTLLMGVPIKIAIGASIVAVIATSSGGAASYVREGMVNLRLAMLLEVSTALGAIAGALLAGSIPDRWLYVMFGLVLAHAAISMIRGGRRAVPIDAPADPLADRLRLHGNYFDVNEHRDVAYRVRRVKLGMFISMFAGLNSGLLGVGGGLIKVPAMNVIMGVPLKVCAATSNFMIGVTAGAGAMVYFVRGDVLPFIAAPVAAGVLIGATAGSKLLSRLRNRVVRSLFLAVIGVTAVQMLWRGVTS